MTDIAPFQIAVPDAVLDDLRHRLTNTRWPEAECVDDWSQGIPLGYTRDLAAYWADGYDWRAREAALNRFDQYVTEIDGLDIHFIHQRSPHPEALPLIITHGWPGSIAEFQKVIGPLTDPTAHGGRAEDAFHVVCPSLPGYGFSGKPAATGWGVERTAQAWDDLMVRLGYPRYGAQGGDWGGAVTTQIGRNVGHCIAIHTNMPMGRPAAGTTELTAEEQHALAALKRYQDVDSGYAKQQSTRPQTIGYGLVDSPVAQLAWIVEKFWSWTDHDGDVESALSRDEMLDDVMIYWATATGASSARLYWESFRVFGGARQKVELPTGVASFPKEILRAPRSWCESGYNITHWTTMPRGGHFAAFEQPELFVDDVRTFFATVR
ncbi:epoxide hydrolase [Mycolicibacterium sp. NCC-Tsukiji]|nr:epoxide hydrolase [Mycolicibacterium sp. NCC-Tsukiji]